MDTTVKRGETFMWIWLAVYWLTAVALASVIYHTGQFHDGIINGTRLEATSARWLGIIAITLVACSTAIHAAWLFCRRR
jgi:hypothetical protein